MYKIFLVEDEIVVRESIRDSIAWENTEFIFAGEAPDGEIALPLIHESEPDIVITDIRMPFMDGLELSSYIKKNMPWMKIIILSGHQEFEYAKKAISIGVEEYVLKPVSSKELLDILGKVAHEIKEEKKQLENIKNMKKYLNDNKELMKEKFLNNLIMGVIPSHVAADTASSFEIDIFSKYYAVVRITIEIDSSPEYEKYLNIEESFNEIMKNKNNMIKFKRSLNEIIIILKGENCEDLKNFCKSVSEDIKERMNIIGFSKISVYVGNIHERIQGISKSYKEILSSRNEKLINNNEEIVQQGPQKLNENEYFEFEDHQILHELRYGNSDSIQQVINRYFDKLKDKKVSIILSTYLAIRINLVVSNFLTELGENFEDVIPKQNIEELAVRFDTSDKLKKYIEDIVEAAYSFREKKKRNLHFDLISSAKQYIGENFSDPNISLNVVANFVSMSPCHFSSVFSQETGETFIQYLTNIRMQKAKELLNTTSMKSGEIGLEIGYKDPHYFSYIFKKNVGCKPRDYRNR